MKRVFYFFLTTIFLAIGNHLSAQCTPPSADNCDEANVLCSLDEVNGYTCMNTDYSNPTGCSPLCPTGGGAHNTSWWAFVTDGGNVCVTITFSNCTVNGTGVQFGIWGDCNCGQSIFCDPNCNGPGTKTACGNLEPCKTYYLFVDGCTGDVCNFTINTSGGSAPMLPPLGNLTGPTTLCKGACNVKYSIDLLGGGACAPAWQWTLDGVEIPDQYNKDIFLDFPDEGDFTLCVTAIIGNPQSGSICDQEGPKCITIKVRQEKDRRDGPRYICFENVPITWQGNNVDATGEYTAHFKDKNCCEYDSVVSFIVLPEVVPPTVYFLGCIGETYKDPTTGKLFSNCQNGTEIELKKATNPHKCDSSYNLVAAFINGTGRMREYCQGGMILLEVSPIDRTCPDGGYVTESYGYKWYLKTDPSKKSIGSDEFLEVTQKDEYCVEITFFGRLENQTKQCKFDICEQFNEDDFKYKKICPKGEQLLCLGKTGKYSVDTIFPADARHIWTVSGGKLLTTNPIASKEIEVLWDFNPAPAKQYTGIICYHMESSCPPTEECCIDVVIKVAPQPSAGPDDRICGLDYKLRGKSDVGNGTWTQVPGGPTTTITPPNSPNPDVNSNGYGRAVFVYSETDLGCTTEDTVVIDFNESPINGPLTYICGSSNKDFVATFQIIGGKAPFKVIRGNGTVDSLGIYTSKTINNLTDEIIEVEDVNGCRFTFTINYECKCTNDIGVMDTRSKDLCQDQCLDIYADNLYDNRNEKLDQNPRDTLIFFVYTDPNNLQGSTRFNLTSTRICYDPNKYTFGQTFYVGAKIGRANNRGDIDPIKGCVRINGGTPITFYEIPRPDAGPDRSVCGFSVDLEGTKSLVVTKGSWKEVNNRNVKYFDITDPVTNVEILDGFGVYTFEYTEDNNNGLCVTTDRVNITFNPNPELANIDKTCTRFGAIGQTDGKYVATVDITTGTGPYILVIPPSTPNGKIVGNQWVSDTIDSNSNFIIVVRDANGCESQLLDDNHNCNCGAVDAGKLDSNLTRVCIDKCVTIKNIIGETIDPEDIVMFILHKFPTGYNNPANVLDTIYDINQLICFDPKTMGTGSNNPVFVTRIVGDDIAPQDGVVDPKDPCRRASNPMEIVFEPYAAPDAGLDGKICGLNYTMKGVLTFGNANWRLISGPGNSTFSDPTDPVTPISVSTIGTYTYEISGDNFGCIGLDTVSVTFVDEPKFTGVKSIVCDNVAENYKIVVGADFGDRPTWDLKGTFDNGTNSLPGTYLVPNGKDWESGWIPTGNNYDLSIEDANKCAIDKINGSHVCPCITLPGTVVLTPKDLCQTTCAQAVYTPGAMDANDVFRYILYDGLPTDPNNGTRLSFNDNGRFCFDPAKMTLGKTYYVAVYAGNLDPATGNVLFSDRCIQRTDGVPVTWYDDPKALITGPNLLTCKDSVLILSGNTSSSASGDQLTYSWNNGTLGSTSTISITTPGTYKLDVVDPRAGCTNSITFVVTQDITKPIVQIEPPLEITCDRTVVNLDGNKSDKGAIYSPNWTPVVNGSNSYLASTNTPGIYTLTVINTFNGCKDSKTITVTEDKVPPTADIKTIGQLTCTVNQVTLDGTGSRPNSGNGLTYTWIGNLINGQGTANATVGKPGGNFVLEVKDNKNGCISRDTILVTEIGNPLGDLVSTPQNPTCHGDVNGQIVIKEVRDKNGNILNGNFTFSINGGPFTSNTSFTNLRQGQYTIMVKDANGCLLTDTEVLVEPSKLGIDVIRSIVVEQGTEVNLDSLLIALFGGTPDANGNYKDTLWFNLDENKSWPNRYIADTTREFRVTGIDIPGCEINDRVRVLVRIVKEVWWPNVINPNSGTSENNFFNLYGKRVREVKLLNIYDRWGELVYSDQHLPDGNRGGRNRGWNGNFNGEKALPGVYVFYAEVQYEGSASVDKFKGEFTLLR